MGELRERLRSIVADVSEIGEIPDGKAFKDLGIDSMMAIEIVAEVERAYKIKVPEEELKGITDLDAMQAVVERHLASR